MTYTILATARSFARENPQPLRLLEAAGCAVIRPRDEDEWRALLPRADGIIAGLETYNAETLAICGRLKVISRYGVGYDAIDLNAARKKGISVAYTPGANSDSVADLAAGLMIAAARHVPFMDAAIRHRASERPPGLEIWRKTLGVLGTGRIGKGVMKRMSGFEMRMLCHDICRDETAVSSLGGSYTDLDTLLTQSDFITIHLPLTGKTRGMIGETAFRKMKSTAVLVNTARGGIVDEHALYEALKNGRLFAAALDTMIDEPPYNSPLAALPNCILTPHAGAATIEAAHNMGMMAAQNLLALLATTCRGGVTGAA
ncbi:MAG: phosphoglycerate dehydrogenase [Spirochaetaceae bacterium]|jgi:D-3-phosphoglycerate dehydrogenase|nr:phosphoglycerate dehydrogenase [Spirochaetaceae bacterium]